jgi:hypothetical protein
MKREIAATLVASAICAGAAAQATRFDGAWNVTMRCPPHVSADDEAKGYTHRFPGQVASGQFSGTHGAEGQPGWHFLRGPIKEDGSAALRLDGIVNNPQHAINDAPRGKPYSYRVKARFDEKSGSGQRVTGRVCEFMFNRM